MLDGRGRTTLKLGDGPEDDVAIGSTARAVLTWTPDGLELRFTPGVEGELSSHGDRSRTFSELVQEGRVKESPEGFALVLKPDDAATLRIGTLIAEIQKARGRFPRLPIDGRALVFLVLAVIAIGLMVASIMAPAEQPKPEWIHKPPVKQPARSPLPETPTHRALASLTKHARSASVSASRPRGMQRTVINSWDPRLGLACIVGVNSRVRANLFARDCVQATTSLVTVNHQCGGISCLQETMTGVVMRCADAHHLAFKPLERLLNGFGLLAESGEPTGPADHRLMPFGDTHGDPIDVKALSRIVAEYLPVPPFDQGVEAFVSGPVDDPRFFSKWTAWHPTLGGFPIDETVNDHLVAAVAISGQPLRAFLLWENSD